MKVEELIDLYGDGILRLCLAYLGDRGLAEDAFQETFLKAWRAQDSFRGESGVKTWLSHIAVNTCRDMLRSGWLRMLRKSRPIEQLGELTAPQDGEDAFSVRDAVLALPGMYREVILLYYDQEMTLREIADVLHMPPNTVSTRLQRARRKLYQSLKGGNAP